VVVDAAEAVEDAVVGAGGASLVVRAKDLRAKERDLRAKERDLRAKEKEKGRAKEKAKG